MFLPARLGFETQLIPFFFAPTLATDQKKSEFLTARIVLPPKTFACPAIFHSASAYQLRIPDTATADRFHPV